MTTWPNFTAASSVTCGSWVSSSSGTTFPNCTFTGSSTATQPLFVIASKEADPVKALAEVLRSGAALDIPTGWRGEIRLPDGTILRNTAGDNFEVVDRDARVTYRGTRDRAFNRYVNASDLLEGFIDFLGDLGVPQHRLLDAPVDLLIHWLIGEAARQDGEDVPAGIGVEAHPKLGLLAPHRHIARCRTCGRFVSRRTVEEGFLYCSPEHYAGRKPATG